MPAATIALRIARRPSLNKEPEDETNLPGH